MMSDHTELFIFWGRERKKKSDFVVRAPVFASRQKQLPVPHCLMHVVTDAVRRGNRNICKTFHEQKKRDKQETNTDL